MIYLVQGTPGSGKTYYACRRIDEAIAAGKVVVTNVQLVDDWAERVARGIPLGRFRRRAVRARAAGYRRQLLVIEDVSELLRVRVEGAGEGRWLAVLDEAGAFLNSRTWNEGDRKHIVKWCQRHRHYGADVLLIAQLPGTIDKAVRELYEEAVKLKNLKNFKVCGLRVFPRCRFVAIHTWNTTDRHVLKRDTYGLSKRIAGLYNTHQLAADLEAEPDATVMPLPAPAPKPRRGRRRTRAERAWADLQAAAATVSEPNSPLDPPADPADLEATDSAVLEQTAPTPQ